MYRNGKHRNQWVAREIATIQRHIHQRLPTIGRVARRVDRKRVAVNQARGHQDRKAGTRGPRAVVMLADPAKLAAILCKRAGRRDGRT